MVFKPDGRFTYCQLSDLRNLQALTMASVGILNC